jgi:hypothetical protein
MQISGKKVYKTTKTWWIQAILIEIRHVHYEHFGHTVRKNNCYVNSNITEPVYWHDFFFFPQNIISFYRIIISVFFPKYYFGFFRIIISFFCINISKNELAILLN